MKRLSFLFIGILLLMLSACKSDDDKGSSNNSANGTFTIDGVTYEIFDDIPGSFYFEDLGLNPGNDFYDYQTGGVAISDTQIGFDICWNNTIDQVSGTFNAEDTVNERPYWEFNCTNIDLSATEFESIVSGTLVVESLGDNRYRVTFNGTSENGKSLTVNFERELTVL